MMDSSSDVANVSALGDRFSNLAMLKRPLASWMMVSYNVNVFSGQVWQKHLPWCYQ